MLCAHLRDRGEIRQIDRLAEVEVDPGSACPATKSITPAQATCFSALTAEAVAPTPPPTSKSRPIRSGRSGKISDRTRP
ncbi:MAG: hypothetical protein U1E87_02530 [Alphaproteobacteria bacterium]